MDDIFEGFAKSNERLDNLTLQVNNLSSPVHGYSNKKPKMANRSKMVPTYYGTRSPLRFLNLDNKTMARTT